MNNDETEFEPESTDKKPRKTRKRAEEKEVYFYLVEDGNSQKLGQFPESVIGKPLERQIPVFAKEMFGKMFYGITELKADIRNANGTFYDSINFSIATEPEREKSNAIEIEPEEYGDEPEVDFYDRSGAQMNTVKVENLLLKERLKRLEDEYSRQKSGNQSEMQTLISALEESRREQRELMMMMLSQSQKPQQDATTQAMNILEKSLGIVTKAKAISEEIAPQATEQSGSLLGDAAKFMDSLGRNAGQFLPMVLNGARSQTFASSTKSRATAPKPNGNQQTGELTDLLAKVKNKKEGNEDVKSTFKRRSKGD